MAVLFDGVDDGLELIATPISNTGPASLAVWWYSTTLNPGANEDIFGVFDDTNPNSELMCRWTPISTNAQIEISWDTPTDTNSLDSAGARYGSGEWVHVGGRFLKNNGNIDQQLYGNGVEVSEILGRTFGGSSVFDRVQIGAGRVGASATRFAPGRIAHVALWNVDIGADAFVELAAGASPKLVQPDSLVLYAPLWNEDYLVDEISGQSFTNISGSNVGTAKGPPRFYMPGGGPRLSKSGPKEISPLSVGIDIELSDINIVQDSPPITPQRGNTTSNDTFSTKSNTLTISNHTVADNVDRVLVVMSAIRIAEWTSAPTCSYGAQSMTIHPDSVELPGGGPVSLVIFYLVGPNVGTANVVITYDAADVDHISAGAVDYWQAEQVTPLVVTGLAFKSDNAGVDSIQQTLIGSDATWLVLDGICRQYNETITEDVEQTELVNRRSDDGTASQNIWIGISERPGGGDVTMGWTNGATRRTGHIITAVKPQPTGSITPDVVAIGVETPLITIAFDPNPEAVQISVDFPTDPVTLEMTITPTAAVQVDIELDDVSIPRTIGPDANGIPAIHILTPAGTIGWAPNPPATPIDIEVPALAIDQDLNPDAALLDVELDDISIVHTLNPDAVQIDLELDDVTIEAGITPDAVQVDIELDPTLLGWGLNPTAVPVNVELSDISFAGPSPFPVEIEVFVPDQTVIRFVEPDPVEIDIELPAHQIGPKIPLAPSQAFLDIVVPVQDVQLDIELGPFLPGFMDLRLEDISITHTVNPDPVTVDLELDPIGQVFALRPGPPAALPRLEIEVPTISVDILNRFPDPTFIDVEVPAIVLDLALQWGFYRQTAFEVRLRVNQMWAIAQSIEHQVDNVPFTHPANAPWARTSIGFSDDPEMTGISGAEHCVSARGAVETTIAVPVALGVEAALDLADALVPLVTAPSKTNTVFFGPASVIREGSDGVNWIVRVVSTFWADDAAPRLAVTPEVVGDRESVQEALRRRFRSEIEVGESVTVYYGNLPATYDGSTYIAFSVVEGGSFISELGATERSAGVMSAIISVPLGTGEGDALDLVDAIDEAFRGINLQGVDVQELTVQPGRQVDAEWRIPITCPWRADRSL